MATEPANITLVGPSTSGKSTVKRALEERLGSSIEIFDTDDHLATDLVRTPRFDVRGHVFEIYLGAFEADGHTGRANTSIAEAEERYLRELMNVPSRPRLVVTGPNVPGRDGWTRYIARYPRCVYLRKAADEVYDGLIDRENRTREKFLAVAQSPGFRSWNDGLTVRLMGGVYVQLDRAGSLEAIEQQLKTQCHRFESTNPFITIDSRDFVGFRQDAAQNLALEALVEKIAAELN